MKTAVEAAKAQNWLVRLLYVGLGNATLNVQRVASRVSDGGHDVPEEDIRRRFERSMANLPLAAEFVDLLSVYDNSDLTIRRVLLIKNHRIRRYASSNGKSWWEIALEPYLKTLEMRE
jgi:predicted ABC-type ATPase